MTDFAGISYKQESNFLILVSKKPGIKGIEKKIIEKIKPGEKC